MKTTALPYYEFRPGIYEIDEFACVSMFLVVGEEKALLIDTGIGIGNLKAVISRITDKPFVVAASHNHLDHIGGADTFDSIWMCRSDIDDGKIEAASSLKDRRDYADFIKHRENKWFPYDTNLEIQAWESVPVFQPMDDAHVFDLGNRKVVAYCCPGHTIGEMVFLDEKTKTLICGDAINCNWYLDPSIGNSAHESLSMACDAMKRIESMSNQYDYVINSHHDYRGFGNQLNPDVLPNLHQCMKSLLDGTAQFKMVNDPMSQNGEKRVSAVKGDVEISVFSPLRIDQI